MCGFVEDTLDYLSHVNLIKNFIAFVKNEKSELVQFHVTAFDQVKNSAWGSNDYVRWSEVEFDSVLIDGDSSEICIATEIAEVLSKSLEFLVNLESELSGVSKNEALRVFFGSEIKLLEHG